MDGRIPTPHHRRTPWTGTTPLLTAPRVVAVCAAFAALLLGLAAGVSPVIAVAGAVALVVLAVVLTDLAAGLCIWIILSFLEDIPAIAGAASATKMVGLVLVAGWLATIAAAPPARRARLDILSEHPLLVWLLGAFLVWSMSSSLWAESPADARSFTVRFALNFVLFAIVYAAVQTPRQIEAVFAVFVVGALTSAVLGMLNGSAGGEGDRLSGSGLNANQLGTLLMVGAILAIGLAATSRLPGVVRWLAALASVLCVILLLATASRGALLGLVVTLLVGPFLAGRGRRLPALALVLTAMVTAVVWLTAFAPADIAHRLTTPDTSGTGRVDIWKVGWRIVEDKTVTGIGAGNFKLASVHYLLEPGRIVRDDFILDTPKVPHNIYLHVLTELGAVGFVLFVSIVLYALICAWRAAVQFERNGDTSSEILARVLLIGLIGLLSAYFFSSQLLGKQLYLLLACGPALLAVARTRRNDAFGDAD